MLWRRTRRVVSSGNDAAPAQGCVARLPRRVYRRLRHAGDGHRTGVPAPAVRTDPAQVGALGASTYLGAIIGLLVFGDMSDRLGRRAIFVANLIFFVVFSIASAFINSVPQLFAARFLVGVGVGMDIPTSMAYLTEITPANRRGAIIGALTQITWILGAMTSTIIALPLSIYFGNDTWRWMFGLAALPALLILLGRRLLPESPRWLMNQGRVEESKAALRAFGMPDDLPPLNASRTGSYSRAVPCAVFAAGVLDLFSVLPELHRRAGDRDPVHPALCRASVDHRHGDLQHLHLVHQPHGGHHQLCVDRSARPAAGCVSVGHSVRCADDPDVPDGA